MLDRGGHVLARHAPGQADDEFLHRLVACEVAVDQACLVDAEMGGHGIEQHRLSIGGESGQLSFMAVADETQRRCCHAISFAQPIDAARLQQAVVAAVERLQPAAAEKPDRVLRVVARAVGRIEQRLRPIGMEEAGQRMGQMMIAERDIRVGPESIVRQKSRRIEQREGIPSAIAVAFDIHVFLFFPAQRTAQPGLQEAGPGKMPIVALGEEAAVQNQNIHLPPLPACNRQAFVHCLDGDAPAIRLAPGQPLLRDGGQRPVFVEQASGAVMGRGTDAENEHGLGEESLRRGSQNGTIRDGRTFGQFARRRLMGSRRRVRADAASRYFMRTTCQTLSKPSPFTWPGFLS